MAALAPAPAPQPPAPPVRAPIAATVAFTLKSAELSDASKVELDRVAKTIVDRNARQIELRAFTGNGDPADRKISLARALIVRTYLIDKGVKSKIEVGAFAGDGNERVDILVPST
jgi:outer membrane protein OmpA-like peptidoglycan-associated protein